MRKQPGGMLANAVSIISRSPEALRKSEDAWGQGTVICFKAQVSTLPGFTKANTVQNISFGYISNLPKSRPCVTGITMRYT